jgi:hypothetical protein
MQRISRAASIAALSLLAPFAAAQNCFDGDFGTLLFENQGDFVAPMQAIGFPFPVGVPAVTYTHIHVSDHGLAFLSNNNVPVPPATNSAILYTPSTANFNGNSPKVCCLYSDTVASGGGQVWFRSSASACTITWRNMQSYGVATPRFSMQMTLYPNGDVRCVYGPNVTNNSTFGGVSDNGIVGIAPVLGGAMLPTPVDLSVSGVTTDQTVFENWTVANTFDLANNSLLFIRTAPGYTWIPLGAPTNCATASSYGTGCGTPALGLAARGLPSIGNANFNFNVSNVPNLAPFAFVGFGDTVVNPGLDVSFIGMPGCFAYTNLNLGLYQTGLVTTGTGNFVIAIPNDPTIVGTLLSAQGVALTLATPLNLSSSNGVQFTVGYGY